MRWNWFASYHFFFKRIEERKQREERERLFYENGSKLLEKLIASCNAKPIPIRTFSAQQLRQATNNFSSEKLVMGFSIWYKGSLEGQIVLIKGSFVHNVKLIPIRTFSPQQLRQATNNYLSQHLGIYWYKGSLEGRIVLIKRLDNLAYIAINDLVISAQMSGHSNVLRPIGCCLHTRIPILVFEFAANGLLADRIYVSRVTELQHEPMVWESRLKIARQIAHALSYLHTAFPRPVIYMAMDLHSILLDEHDVPKLSHFHFSVSIPEGEVDVDAPFLSTFKSPEFKTAGKVTEKADVYDFGRFLLELLTGDDSFKDSTFIAYIHNCAQGSCINEIVDPAILAEGGASLQHQLQAVVDLALACTEEDPQTRPTMVDVTKQLRRIERFTKMGEKLGGNLQNLKLRESFEEHAFVSLKRNASSDEIQAVNEASERPLEV
ncbi:non-functional pseudokinase ZED1-like isoform X1 [Quercus lobata]|uniref:non-functional pseudokinase ZED1-like isoform X1 n=1 Tax=Quercus lobata TaxID=97700 RepID=UPI00124847E1|nr:non-functional pseudokinase ZED1-like isoform X1 [Quercus lobata]